MADALPKSAVRLANYDSRPYELRLIEASKSHTPSSQYLLPDFILPPSPTRVLVERLPHHPAVDVGSGLFKMGQNPHLNWRLDTALMFHLPVGDEAWGMGLQLGVVAQRLSLSSVQSGLHSEGVAWTEGVQASLNIGYRILDHLRIVSGLGVGLHAGSLSSGRTTRFMTAGDTALRIGVMMPGAFGLPQALAPMVYLSGGVYLGHLPSGSFHLSGMVGGGLGMLMRF